MAHFHVITKKLDDDKVGLLVSSLFLSYLLAYLFNLAYSMDHVWKSYVQFKITVSSSQKMDWLNVSIERIVSASNVLAVCLLKTKQPFCLPSAQKIQLVNELWYHRLYLGVWSWSVLYLLIEAWIGIFLGNDVLITPSSCYLWHNHRFVHFDNPKQLLPVSSPSSLFTWIIPISCYLCWIIISLYETKGPSLMYTKQRDHH